MQFTETYSTVVADAVRTQVDAGDRGVGRESLRETPGTFVTDTVVVEFHACEAAVASDGPTVKFLEVATDHSMKEQLNLNVNPNPHCCFN